MKSILILVSFVVSCSAYSQIPVEGRAPDEILPVRGFCIAAPQPDGLDRFLKFVEEELAPRKINTLILRVDYNYQYESFPNLRNSVALTKEDVEKLVVVCRKNEIRIIPQINLLGHQSWKENTGNLLREYPEFDETPEISLPDNYEWPNSDGLYCKSYCPLHPEVHKVVFALIDEICSVFEADAFHAGMDEVFYIGERQCPRCSGQDKSELYAGEVRTIHDHLALNGRQLWIWGDRLIDGKTTGIGEWEGSYNNTYRALDLIPKDVVICDWHYERPDQTPVLFAMKGLSVVTCPWRNSESALLQSGDMVRFRNHSTSQMKERFRGIVQTIWTPAERFMDAFYSTSATGEEDTEVKCFKTLFEEISRLISANK
jgi:hypothetical protein